MSSTVRPLTTRSSSQSSVSIAVKPPATTPNTAIKPALDVTSISVKHPLTNAVDWTSFAGSSFVGTGRLDSREYHFLFALVRRGPLRDADKDGFTC